MTQPPPAADALPVLETARLAGLKFLPADKLPALFAQVLASADALAAAEPDAIALAAHRVKGSAGTVGLARLAASAAELETQAKQGQVETSARAKFAAVLAASREVLREQGLLAP